MALTAKQGEAFPQQVNFQSEASGLITSESEFALAVQQAGYYPSK